MGSQPLANTRGGCKSRKRKKRNRIEKKRNERTCRMSLFGRRYFGDTRNGWPFDYHRSFWENYYDNYYQPPGSYDWDFSYPYSYPYTYGPRDESYLWNHEALPTPACPSCYRASIEAYKDYPRRAIRGVTHYMGLARSMGDLY